MPNMTKDPVASPPPGPQMVTPTTTASVSQRRDGVLVDLAAERRRRRGRRPGPNAAWWCPQRYGAFSSAAIAELSGRLGSLDAAYRHLDAERAAAEALAEARLAKALDLVRRVSWSADQKRRRDEWRATPPEWMTGKGWPEPGGAAS